MCSSTLSVTRHAVRRVGVVALCAIAWLQALPASAQSPVAPARQGTLLPATALERLNLEPRPARDANRLPRRPLTRAVGGKSPAVPREMGGPLGIQHRASSGPDRGQGKSRRADTETSTSALSGDAGGTEEPATTTALLGSGGGSPQFPTPAPSASFLALNDNATRFNPDTSGAVGPNHVMVALASEIRIQNRDGSEVSRMASADFWAPLGSFDVFDTRLLYDPYGQRWIHLAVAGGTADPGLLLAVSQSSNPAGSWHRYFIDTDVEDPYFPESPNIGFNKKWIVIQANMFSSVDFLYYESQVFVLDKAVTYAGGPADFTMFSLPYEQYGDSINAQVPATTYDPDVEELYLVGHWNNNYFEPSLGFNLGSIRIYTIAGTTPFPVLTPGSAPQVGQPWDPFAPNSVDFLPQSGTTNKIAAGDARIQAVVYRNGSLWTTHTVFLPANAPTRTTVQWWEILPVTGAIFQFGRISTTSSPNFYAYPSIAVNRDNDVLLGYSAFSGTTFPAAAYSFKTDVFDEPDVMRPPLTLKAGEARYYAPDNGRNYWGDWSAAVIDPLNDIDMWTVQEYGAMPVQSLDRWGTWWGRVSPEVDLSVSMTGTPSTLLAGGEIQYSVTLTNFNQTRTSTGVKLVNTLPAGTEFVSASSSRGPCTHSNGVITCQLGDLVQDDAATVQIRLRTLTDGQIQNTVVASAFGPDTFPDDNVASFTANVNPAADLTLAVTASPSLPVQGQEMYYNIVVTNLGLSSATTVKFTNYFPATVTYVRTVPTQGSCTRSGNRIICTLGRLDPGQSAGAVITVVPNGGGQLVNQAYATSATFDPNLANNQRTTSIVANALPVVSSFTTQTINEDAATGPIPFTVSDLETPAGSLLVSATGDNPALLPQANISLGGSGANRTLSLTPLPNQNGNANITVQVTDANAASNSTTFLFRVLAINDPPTISAINDQVLDEDGVTGDLPFTIGDVELAPNLLTVSRTSSNTGLIPVTRVFLGGSGANRTVRVEPNANQFGTAIITINVSDGVNITSETFQVTVNSINDPPTLSSLSNRSSNEDTATPSFAFTIGDVESTTAELTVTAQSSNPTLLPVGNILLSGGTDASRLFSLTPAPNEFGSATVTLRVADPNGGQVEDSFLYTVVPVNDAPYINPLPDIDVNEDSGPVLVDLGGIAAGPTNEFDALTVTATSSLTTRVPHPQVQYTSPQSTGRLTAILVTNTFGSVTITVRVQDDQAVNNATTLTFKINILPVNDPPEIGAIPGQVIDEDTSTGAIAFTVNDVETANGSLVLSASTSNPQLIPVDRITFGGLGGNRNVTATPLPDTFGTADITVHVSDGTDITSRLFTLTVNPVNDPPTLSAPGNQATNEDVAAGPFTFLVRDVETPLANLDLSAFSSNTGLVPNDNITLGLQGTNGTVSVQPLANASGSATITLMARDEGDLTAMGSFTLTVNAVNDPPTLDALSDRSMNEDAGPLQVALSGIGSGAANEAQTLTVTARSSNTAILPDPVAAYTSPASTGMLTLNPLPHANGDVTVTVEVRDGGTTNHLASRQFTLSIQPVNDPPSISAIPGQVINEDTPTPSIAFTVQDVETPTASLNVFGFSSNEELIFADGIQISGTGTNRTLVVQALPDQFGEAFVFITVEDGQGESATTQFLVTVNPVNDLPTFSAIPNPSSREDTPTGAIPVMVFDVETPPGSLTLSARSGNTALLRDAGITLGGSGINRTVTLNPEPNAFGQAVVELRLGDGTATNMTSFTYTVDPVNDPPALDAVPARALDEDTTLSVTLTGIHSGAANEAQTLVLGAASDNPALLPNPSVTYTSPAATAQVLLQPALNAHGEATVTLTLNDGLATNNLATRSFLVTVNPVNDLPTISTISNRSTREDTPTTPISFIVQDVETPAANLLLVGSSSDEEIVFNGSIVFSGSGPSRSATITPATNQIGTVTISISVEDQDGGQRSTQFTLGVAPVNDAPTLDPLSDRHLLLGGAANSVPLTGIGSGAFNESQALTVTATSSNPAQIAHPTVTYSSPNDAGTLTLDASRAGSAVITVRVMDNGGTGFGGIDAIQRTFSQTVQPAPQLNIRLESGNVRLAWSASALGMLLESREQVDSGAWTVVNVPPVQVGDEWVVTLPVDGLGRYFQLRTP